MSFKKRNIRLVEDINFLNNKFIIFDNDATEQDVRKVYQFLTSMGATPLSVAINSLSTDTFINLYIPEIMEFIDNYDGAYFRVWQSSWSHLGGGLALDYGAINHKDLDLRDVDRSKIVDYKEILDLSDTNFFPEELNESLHVVGNIDKLLQEWNWIVMPVSDITDEQFQELQLYLYSKGIYWQGGGDAVRSMPLDLGWIYIGRYPYYNGRPPHEQIATIGWTFYHDGIWRPEEDPSYAEDYRLWNPKYKIVRYYDIILDDDDLDMDTAFEPLNEAEDYPSRTPDEGDTLICHTPVIMEEDGEVMTTRGKTYGVINRESGTIYIKNDINQEHGFDTDPNSRSYFKKWFDTFNYPSEEVTGLLDDAFGEL